MLCKHCGNIVILVCYFVGNMNNSTLNDFNLISGDTDANKNTMSQPQHINNKKNETNSNIKILAREDLLNLDKEHLVDKVISMQEHIKQLKAIILKQQQQQIENGSKLKGSHSKKPAREFDFSRYKQRHVFLKFFYLGWNYDGFVVQEDSLNTVEAVLFDALLKTKLIQSRESANYHRCGRTDKGVSAFSQVVSLTVRSQRKHGFGVFTPEDYSGIEVNDDDAVANGEKGQDETQLDEIDYISALNGVLPGDIRVYAWAPIASRDTSARFDCKHRRYYYYFPRGGLDIDRMHEACQYLVGEHDFRNLCKMDINNGVINYCRTVLSASVQSIGISSDRAEEERKDPHSICLFQIEATAFLWHQIRCIMGILFLVGQRLEEPSIIVRLLNVTEHPAKPNYSMAAELPLVLYDAHYEMASVPRWNYGKGSQNVDPLKSVINQLHEEWAKKAIQSAITKSMIDSLTLTYERQTGAPLPFDQINSHLNVLLSGVKSRIYKPLFERPVCETLESRLEKRQSKKRIKLDIK